MQLDRWPWKRATFVFTHILSTSTFHSLTVFSSPTVPTFDFFFFTCTDCYASLMFPSFHKRNAAAVVRAAPATWTPALSVAAVHVSSLASTASRPLSAASEAHLRRQASQRHAAWTQFTSASRQLRKAVHTPATVAAGHQAATTSLPSSYMAVAGMEESNSDDALAALAPSIIRRTSTAAASAALMRELGVIYRAEYRPENVYAS